MSESSAIGGETEAVTVTLFRAESDVAAKAGDADNGVYKAEDALDILDGYDLAKMVFLHPSGDKPSGDGPYDGRRLCKLVQTPYMSLGFSLVIIHLIFSAAISSISSTDSSNDGISG